MATRIKIDHNLANYKFPLSYTSNVSVIPSKMRLVNSNLAIFVLFLHKVDSRIFVIIKPRYK